MDIKRREFLLKATLGGGLLGLSGFSKADPVGLAARINEKLVRKVSGSSNINHQVDPIPEVGVGFIGVGNRGTSHLKQFAAMSEKAKVKAICDIRKPMADRGVKIAKELGHKVASYSGKENIWKEMLQRDDIHLVVIATPWEYHAPMALEAMRRGKHVAVEIPMGITVEELNEVVEVSEQTGMHCMMMENVNYGNEELWILNMVQQGIFGTLTHGEAAYIHDLKIPYLFGNAYYNSWRMRHHLTWDGNLYPTHGLGPIAWYMDIHRGDRFDYMVSMSSLQANLTEFSKTVDSSNEWYNRDDFKHGDMNSSLIKTVKGRSILVQHDVVTNRPYSRINALAGTKGYHEGYPSRLALGHSWMKEEEYKEYREKYNHPIWNTLKEEIEKHRGHGGMDIVMNYRILDCLNKGLPLDQNVYDGAAWSAVFPLSILSVQLGSIPVKFPDWTGGEWEEKHNLGIMNL